MILTVDEFNYKLFQNIDIVKNSAGRKVSKGRKNYLNLICAFDIETSRVGDHAVTYVWQFQCDDFGTVMGRTIQEAQIFFKRISDSIEERGTLVIFVHNLSYEFQFLAGVYNFMTEEVFAVDNRKVLKCSMYNNIEFRCSYLLTNMSLAVFTKKMGVIHAKLSGEDFDYSIVRYPWTVLTDEEIQYCVNDVLGLVEALKIYMEINNDTLVTLPYTSTGFVRRDAKKAMRDTNYMWRCSLMPSLNTYYLLREAFRGGDTHANRWYSDTVVENVKCYDRSSSYPEVICNMPFPVSEFKSIEIVDEEYLNKMVYEKNRACLFRCILYNVTLTDEMWGCPYLSKDKCRNIVEGQFDNGRILSASSLAVTLTDVDYKIIKKEYDFSDITIVDFQYAKYGDLPVQFTDLNRKYFTDKTKLKNVEGQEIYYMLSKALLNSIYGMCAQNPVKHNIEFCEGQWQLNIGNEEELLKKSNSKAFLPYSWGVWVTAWARYRLHEGMWNIGAENFIYCDTDSVYYIGDVSWDGLNETIRNRSIETNSYATDPSGVTHYLGVWEEDKKCDLFKTLGAKKYVYEKNGQVYITIAGVNKKKGAQELTKHGGINAFREGFTFVEAGGTESVYNDLEDGFALHIDGHELIVTRNVLIKESTYTVGITAEYQRLLGDVFTYRVLRERYKNNQKSG